MDPGTQDRYQRLMAYLRRQSVRHSATAGMLAERFEDVEPAKVRIPSATCSAAYRIPDILTDEALIEIKNVKRQRLSRQLQDFLHYCRATNRRFVLYVRPDTIVTRAVAELHEAGALSIRHLHPAFTAEGQRRHRNAMRPMVDAALERLLSRVSST